MRLPDPRTRADLIEYERDRATLHGRQWVSTVETTVPGAEAFARIDFVGERPIVIFAWSCDDC